MAYKIIDCFRENPYRYSLTVLTDCNSERSLIVIQCNPSKACENMSDPTVGKVSIWAEENGFSKVLFLNLFACVSSQPVDLKGKSDEILARHIKNGGLVVLAWGGGVPDGSYQRRLTEIKQLLDHAEITPNHVGALSYGRYPRHGRMWNKGNREISVLDWGAIIA
jgi:hypothetical protein